VQFHLEITPEIISNWNRAWVEDIEAVRGPGYVKKLEAETVKIWAEYKPLAIRILKNWADLASG
jgi:hypothetical protein